MRNNDFPVTSLTSLARAIAQFASRHQYVTDYKNRLRQEILENPDMSLLMKTLDSDRLNEVFERFTMLFKTFAPMYTRSQRRDLNVASAQARIDNSTVKAIMHSKVDAGGENGEIRLYDGIRSEAKNIMFALTEVAKHFGELRKDGKMIAIALRKAAQASGALGSINRLIQEVAIARRSGVHVVVWQSALCALATPCSRCFLTVFLEPPSALAALVILWRGRHTRRGGDILPVFPQQIGRHAGAVERDERIVLARRLEVDLKKPFSEATLRSVEYGRRTKKNAIFAQLLAKKKVVIYFEIVRLLCTAPRIRQGVAKFSKQRTKGNEEEFHSD